MNKKEITENRRITLMNVIQDALEDQNYFNEWEAGFLEDIQKQIQNGNDLTRRQWEKLIDIIPEAI